MKKEIQEFFYFFIHRTINKKTEEHRGDGQYKSGIPAAFIFM